MKFKKRNIQIVDHSTGQTLDFPTFGKPVGEEAIRDLEKNIDNKIAGLKNLVGSPLQASTISAMTNEEKIYVYTGNESGYTNGHWYYYNGTTWTDGGAYNSVAIETDKTLSVEDMPADAKKTGDEININAYRLSLLDNYNIFDWENLPAQYYSYDGYTLSIVSNDTRNEKNITQRVYLTAGETYVFMHDGCTSIRVFVYQPETQYFALDVRYSTNSYYESEFTPTYTGTYVIKAVQLGPAPHSINHPVLTTKERFEFVKNTGITIKEYSGISDDVSINRAIKHANLHGIGSVYIPYKSSGYTLTDSIKLFSNVCLNVAKNTLLKLDDGVNVPIIRNANFATSSSSTVADQNIAINGGIWDGNADNQDKWTTVEGLQTLTVLFKFSGVNNLHIKNCKLQNSVTYAFLGCAVTSCVIDSCIIDVGDMQNLNNGDGIHFLGCCENITVKNCTIHSEDNCIAFNADDVNHGYACFNGAIDKVCLYNNYINNYDGGQGLLFLSAVNKLSNVVVDGLYGVGGYCLKIDNFGLIENGDGIYENIEIRNIDFEINKNPDYGIRLRGDMKRIRFKNITLKYLDDTLVSANSFRVFEIRTSAENQQTTGTDISDLTIDGLTVIHDWTAREMFGFILFGGAVIRSLTLNNYNVINPSGGVVPVYLEDADINYLYGDNWLLHNLPYGYIRTANSGHSVQRIYLKNIGTDDYGVSGFKFATAPITLHITGISNGWVYIPVTISDLYLDNGVLVDTGIFNTKNAKYFREGQLVYNNNGRMYLCVTAGSPLTTAWAANTDYSKGQYVRADGWVLKCIKAGTSGNALTVGYADFADGTCVWRKMYNGTSAFRLVTVT